MPPRANDAWDDWESEDYSRSSSAASKNARIWQVANNSLNLAPAGLGPSGYPPLGASYGYASPSTAALPPAQAYMPSLKILKRPDSGASGRGSGSGAHSPSGPAKTAEELLRDKERAYREARSRIFGGADGEPAMVLAQPQPQMQMQPDGQAYGQSRAAAGPGPSSNENSEYEGQPAAPPREDGGKQRRQQQQGQPLQSRKTGASSSSGAREGQRKGKQKAVPGLPADTTTAPGVAGSAPSSGRATPVVINGVTILREPVNPPSSKGRDGPLPRGFNTARRQPQRRQLSAAAVEFTPAAFRTASPAPAPLPATVASSAQDGQARGEGQPLSAKLEGLAL